METTLYRTKLYEEHLALGGRMVPFAGWELPVQYDATGPTLEHMAVREAAGLFDIDHMGQIRVIGPDAEAFLNYIQTSDVRNIETFGTHYGLMVNQQGGTVDDIFIYKLEDAWWVIVNAANRAKDLAWMMEHSKNYSVEIENISDETHMLALQGPKAQLILQKITDIDLAGVPFHTCRWGSVAGTRALIGATGYTGEYGYELYFTADYAVHVWREILAAGEAEGLLPCGLAARDSLRIEPCLPLYGHELNEIIDPFTAGLGIFVNFDKGDFVGREALLEIKEKGPTRKLIGFEMQEPAVPREGYTVNKDGWQVGFVTSGMKSPTMGKFLGMAIVQSDYASPGTSIDILIREKPKKATVVKRPFYTPAYRRKV